jgi:hypothetical protein
MRLLRHPIRPHNHIPFFIPHHQLQSHREWQKYLPQEN